jgi:hypothetical protein
MAGKPGQKSKKVSEVANRYRENFLDSMDGRAEVTRTLRERFSTLTADLGGISNLSYQEHSLCRRIIHLERLIEKDELTLAHNGTIDRHAHFAALNSLSSLFSKLGLRRRAKQIPSLSDYLRKDGNVSPPGQKPTT